VDWLIGEFKKRTTSDLGKDRMALQRLKKRREKAKIELSQMMETEINLPFITAGPSGPIPHAGEVDPHTVGTIDERPAGPLDEAGANWPWKTPSFPDRHQEVVLVGGSTRIPKVQQLVRNFFAGKEPHKGVNPDEVVAVAPGVQGAVLGGEVKGHPAARRHAAFFGRGNAGRSDDTADSAQYHDSDAQGGNVLDSFGQSAGSGDSRSARRAQNSRKDNRSLGTFKLDGIPPAPRGTPQIEVTFDIDANGILNVSAKGQGYQ